MELSRLNFVVSMAMVFGLEIFRVASLIPRLHPSKRLETGTASRAHSRLGKHGSS